MIQGRLPIGLRRRVQDVMPLEFNTAPQDCYFQSTTSIPLKRSSSFARGSFPTRSVRRSGQRSQSEERSPPSPLAVPVRRAETETFPGACVPLKRTRFSDSQLAAHSIHGIGYIFWRVPREVLLKGIAEQLASRLLRMPRGPLCRFEYIVSNGNRGLHTFHASGKTSPIGSSKPGRAASVSVSPCPNVRMDFPGA